MRRVFWITLGATTGVLVVRRLTRLANRWTPEGVAQRAGGAGERMSGFWAEVQEAAAEREAELRAALGLDGRHDAVDADLDAGPTAGPAAGPAAEVRSENGSEGRVPVEDNR